MSSLNGGGEYEMELKGEEVGSNREERELRSGTRAALGLTGLTPAARLTGNEWLAKTAADPILFKPLALAICC